MGSRSIAAIVVVGAGISIAVATRGGGSRADERRVDFASVQEILARRCAVCHAEEPTTDLFEAPPGGIRLETAEQVRALIPRIRAAVIDSRIMPLGNMTGMTEDERALLRAWIDQGASTEP